MTAILELLKSYFVLLLLLLLLSYLAPKESYKKYFQFFIGAWMCVLLIRPVFSWLNQGKEIVMKHQEEVEEQLSQIDQWQEEGVDVFELFFMDSEVDE